MSEIGVSCTLMRGGTSKGLFFLDSDLPSDSELRTRTILAAFGSPDPRQIDGLGGADPLTSKVAIIRPSDEPEIDVEYTFGQVSISEPWIDFSANCGNMSSAVGPFAIEKRLVSPQQPVTRVRILNTNTSKVIVSEVPVRDGKVVTGGTYRIDGVPGSGAEIKLHFLDPGGGATGKLLPTGNPRDQITLEDGKTVDVSIVDAGNPAGFVRADQIGLGGHELPEQIESRNEILTLLEELRAKISEILGLCSSWRQAYQHYTSLPKIVFVAQPTTFETLQGEVIQAERIDILARVMAMGRLHKAFAVTAGIPTAAASRIPGSVVHQLCRQRPKTLSIGHPSGTLSLEVAVEGGEEGVSVREVVVGRTARKLMEGTVFVNG